MSDTIRMVKTALILGNSDGIGRALTRLLLADGWVVTGLSRSPCPELGPEAHVVRDVTDDGYREELEALVEQRGPFDACIWCVGIGESLDPERFAHEERVLTTNLLRAVTTVEVVVPRMVAAGRGHFVGLSSLADVALIRGAPSYSASKAGLSSYLKALALACRPHGVAVTNVRFGFVDTKMAQSRWKPFLITAERAARVVRRCLVTRPVQVSHPRTAALAMQLAAVLTAVRVWLP